LGIDLEYLSVASAGRIVGNHRIDGRVADIVVHPSVLTIDRAEREALEVGRIRAAAAHIGRAITIAAVQAMQKDLDMLCDSFQ